MKAAINMNTTFGISREAGIDRHPGNVALHLASEVGEVCDHINRPARQKEPLVNEIADTIHCLLDLYYLTEVKKSEYMDLNESEFREALADELNEALKLKGEKWKSQLR